ncbi:MAG: sigma-70 family RNA polymerase sigma factor [Phycisphaerae bacterium]
MSDGRLDAADERRLIHQAQGGCRVSARRLIDAHQDRLSAFVARMIRDRDDVEEICQEAFLKAFAALDSFDVQFRFSTWLFTIAYRLCLNTMRRHRSTVVGAADLSQFSTPDDGGAGDAVANSDAARRLKSSIWGAVDELPAAQRATVLLFYREQLSCQQIGEILEIPAATVKSHLHRARARLRDALGGQLAADWSEVRFEADAG